MMKKVLPQKLVRDKIPEVLEKSQTIVSQKILSEKAFCGALRQKVVEEAQEVASTVTEQSLKEEVADLYEVLDALMKAYGIDMQEVKSIQEEKRLKKGGFEKRIFIESVEYQEGSEVDWYFRDYEKVENQEV